MASWELVIRIFDKTHPNTTRDKTVPKAGDIISYKPHPFNWTVADIGPERRVLIVDDVTEDEMQKIFYASNVLELPWNNGRFDSTIVNLLKGLQPNQKGRISRDTALGAYQSTKIQRVG